MAKKRPWVEICMAWIENWGVSGPNRTGILLYFLSSARLIFWGVIDNTDEELSSFSKTNSPWGLFFSAALCARSVQFLHEASAPGVTRTPGAGIRNPLLYPPELRGHYFVALNTFNLSRRSESRYISRPLYSSFPLGQSRPSLG